MPGSLYSAHVINKGGKLLGYVALQVGIILSLRVLEVEPFLIGLTELMSGLGAIAGAALVRPLNQRLTLGKLILLAAWGIAIAGILMAVAFPNIWLVLPICFLNTLFVPALNGSLMGHVFAGAPEDLAGRIGASAALMSTLMVPIAPVSAGYLIEYYSGNLALSFFAAILFTLALILTLSPRIRQLAW